MTAVYQVAECRRILRKWAMLQNHDRCWYYPDIFKELAEALDVDLSCADPCRPPIEEFRKGCEQYQAQEYGL